MDFMWRYHGEKGVPFTQMEDGVLGILAPPGDLEESASHHVPVLSRVALLLYEPELLNGSSGALRVMDLKHCASARTSGHLSGHLGLYNGL